MVDSRNNGKTEKISISIPEGILVRIDKYISINRGNRSSLISIAVDDYLSKANAASGMDDKSSEAIDYFYNQRFSLELHRTFIESSISHLQNDVDYIARAFETLFRVRRRPEELEVPTKEDFKEMLSEAVGAYIKDEALLTPDLNSDSELQKAVRKQAYDNAVEEAKALLKSMPFMNDSRFYIDHTVQGPGVYDREFKAFGPEDVFSITGDFPVVAIDVERSEMTVSYPASRPFFVLNQNDNRSMNYIYGPQAITEIVPVIMADYLAFRERSTALTKKF